MAKRRTSTAEWLQLSEMEQIAARLYIGLRRCLLLAQDGSGDDLADAIQQTAKVTLQRAGMDTGSLTWQAWQLAAIDPATGDECEVSAYIH